jgi:hypothetical protein
VWVWGVVINRVDWPPVYHISFLAGGSGYDPRIVPIWYAVSGDVRERFHVPAMIVNWLYPKVQTPYIYWLSDDDLIDPDGLGLLLDAAWPYRKATKGAIPYEHDAVYGRCEVVDEQADGSYAHGSWCYPGLHDGIISMEFQDGNGKPLSKLAAGDASGWDVGLGTAVNPHCLLDGGQVLHTAELWRKATADGWTLTDSKTDAPTNDGTLLNRLAQFARFHYVPQRIVTHRRHKGATYHGPQVSA